MSSRLQVRRPTTTQAQTYVKSSKVKAQGQISPNYSVHHHTCFW